MYSDNGSSESIFEKYHHYSMRYQAFLDRLNGKPLIRWCFFLFLVSVYLFRVFYWTGWYIVTYALAIYYLNLFIAFLSPQVDPELLDDVESMETNEKMVLPNVSVNRNFKRRQSEDADSEFRPFVRRLPEFKFWYSMTKAMLFALFFTSSRVFDIPVYWPILLGYFIILFALTMRKQIQHMIKYRYVPFNIGKKSYKSTPNPIHSLIQSSNVPQVAKVNYSPSVGISTAYQPPKPGLIQHSASQPSVMSSSFQQATGVYSTASNTFGSGFQPIVTPQTSSSPTLTTETQHHHPVNQSKTGKKD
jgi:hypothetical protein